MAIQSDKRMDNEKRVLHQVGKQNGWSSQFIHRADV